MQKEELEKLGEDLIAQIKEKGIDLDDFVSKKDGAYIPRETFNKEQDKLKQEIKTLQDQVAERDSGLEELKKKVAAGEDATEKIKELELKNQESQKKYDSDLLLIQKKAHAKLLLTKAGAINPELLVDKIDYETVTRIDDNTFPGLNEQIEAMKTTSYKSQFGKTVLKGEPTNLDVENPTPKADLDKLQAAHTEALKNGKTLEALKINRQITELQQKKQE